VPFDPARSPILNSHWFKKYLVPPWCRRDVALFCNLINLINHNKSRDFFANFEMMTVGQFEIIYFLGFTKPNFLGFTKPNF
jgi:hypothetical protein